MVPPRQDLPLRKPVFETSRKEISLREAERPKSFAAQKTKEPFKVISTLQKAQNEPLIQRLVTHRESQKHREPVSLLLKNRPAKRQAVPERRLLPSGVQEAQRKSQSGPLRQGQTVVQRMLDTRLQKPLRLTLNKKSVQKENPASVHVPGISILTAGYQAGHLVQRIRARNKPSEQKTKPENRQSVAESLETLRLKTEQAFPRHRRITGD